MGMLQPQILQEVQDVRAEVKHLEQLDNNLYNQILTEIKKLSEQLGDVYTLRAEVKTLKAELATVKTLVHLE